MKTVSMGSRRSLSAVTFVVALGACGTAPVRPMAAERDPASEEAAEVEYLLPPNPLSHSVWSAADEADVAPDPHAGHTMPMPAPPNAKPPDPHAGHEMPAPEPK